MKLNYSQFSTWIGFRVYSYDSNFTIYKSYWNMEYGWLFRDFPWTQKCLHNYICENLLTSSMFSDDRMEFSRKELEATTT